MRLNRVKTWRHAAASAATKNIMELAKYFMNCLSDFRELRLCEYTATRPSQKKCITVRLSLTVFNKGQPFIKHVVKQMT